MFSHSADDIDFNDNSMVCHYYDSIIRLRHDCLHYALSIALKGKFEQEKRIDEIFPNYYGENGGLTPDIIFIDNYNIYIIDVSFSKNAQVNYFLKKDKYEIVRLELQQLLHRNVEVIPVCLDHKLNIKKAISEIKHKFKNNFNHRFIRDVYDLYVQKLNFINSHGKASLIIEHAEINFSDVPIVGLEDDFNLDDDLIESIKNEKYPYKIKTEIDINDFLKMIKDDIDNDGVLLNKYKDKENKVDQYDLAYKSIIENNNNYTIKIKPTIHALFPEKEDILPIVKGKYSEQSMIANFMRFIDDTLDNTINTEDSFIKILASSHTKMINDPCYNNCFNKGVYFNKEEENNNRNIYDEYRNRFYDGKRKRTQESTKSYFNYLIEENKLKESNYFSTMTKTINFNKSTIGAPFKEHWKKSGVQWHKNHENKVFKERTTVPLDHDNLLDDFIDNLTEERSGYYNDTFVQMEDFIKYTEMSDSSFCKNLKKIAWKEMEPWYDLLSHSRAHEFAYFNHLFYSQLMHYSALSTTPTTMHLFNCGIPNFLGIMIGGYNSIIDEAGKPFTTLLLTKNPNKYTAIYGGLIKIKLKDDVWLIMTEWRRLPVMKCTYLRDSFYSSFASGLNYCCYTTMREDTQKRFEKSLDQYVVKVITSHCVTQQIAEFLLDTRFALMSSFSKYTNIYKLLAEKFAPPYTNIMSVWIVNRLFKKLKEITNSMLESETIMFKKIDYNVMGRSRDSIGGYINIPSLWTNHKLHNIHEVLDEAFLYVHTMKEPSSMFHEQIKAVKTIIDFQKEFDETIEDYKRGYVNDPTGIKNFLLSDSNIGFSGGIIKESTEHTLQIIKPNYKKIQNDVLTEPLSNVVSTKAVIHSLERELKEGKVSKNYIKKMKKLLKLLGKDDEPVKKYCLSAKSKFYKTKTRQKVWETIIELLEKYPDADTVSKMSCELVKEQRAKVEADICIKSQYGAKREFYVVNVGAKLLARQVEKTFEYISKVTPEEAISIPGDEKMISMQRMLDNATQLARNGGYKLMYVNGDCTKWSAAETMGSFLAMTESFNDKFTKKYTNLMKMTFSTWADKTINIPISIYNKVYPTNQTDYLHKLTENNLRGINSTHNFLQGMFNYASSFKSVCCSNYSYDCWLKMYPSSDLKVYHMEHSDDYVMIILYKNEKDFINYRAFHKMMMKLHGFNDSERKTSCQTLFLEFVSVMSFNGEMLYPQIKKSKEINLNLPCLGYPTDSEAAISRMGECVRVGCNLSFSYIFGKIHNYCLAEAYSMLPGMINHFTDDYKKLFERPIEIFGIPDQYPLFSLLCKGSINNYRLFKYGSNKTRKIINGLYALNKVIPNEIDEMTENNPEFTKCLYTPRFVYEMENNQIKFIRKNLNILPEDLKSYWEEFKVFRFIKPTKNKYLSKWMQAMFYNRLFSEAYTAVSRTRMTMRLSRYVKTKTLVMTITGDILINEGQLKDKSSNKMTLRESYYKLLDELKNVDVSQINEKDVHQILVKCDANVTAVYSYLEKSNINIIKEQYDKTSLRASKTPHKITWFTIENNIGVVLMKLISPEIFEEEKRYYISDRSLERDIKTIKKELLVDKNVENLGIMELQFLFNQLTLNKSKQITMLGYSSINSSFNDFITDMLENGVYCDHTATITTAGVTEIQNPFTTKTFFMKQKKGTKNLLGQGLDTLVVLYSYLKITLKYDDERIKEIIENLEFCTNPIKNEKMNYKELLNKISLQTKDNMQLSIKDMKCAAYLQNVLLGNSTLLTGLTNNLYMYGYKYYKKANYHAGKWSGVTECAFNYLNNKFYLHQIDNNNPTLFTITKNHQINCAAYLVALRLSSKISVKEFELHKYDHTLNSYKTIRSNLPKPIIASRTKKMTHIHNGIKWEITSNYEPNDIVLPLIKVYGSMPLTEQNFVINQKYIPKITDEILMVSMGRMKLFTLPFWECDQYDCVLSKDNPLVAGVRLNTLLKNRLIHKQLNNAGILSIKSWEPCTISSVEYMELLRRTNQEISIEMDDKIKGMEEFFKKIKISEQEQLEKMVMDESIDYLMNDLDKDEIFDLSNYNFNISDDDEKEEGVFNFDSFGFDINKDRNEEDEEEEEIIMNFDTPGWGEIVENFNYNDYNVSDLIKQNDELFTELSEFDFYETKEEINLEEPHQLDEYWDATKGINFSQIKLIETKRTTQKTNIGGMILKLATLEPIINHYLRLAYHLRLPRHGFLEGVKYLVTTTDLIKKINLENDDFQKTVLLYEFYYLIKNISIKNDNLELRQYHIKIENNIVNYYYHYPTNDVNLIKKLKGKYEYVLDDTDTHIFFLNVKIDKLKQMVGDNMPKPYEFNRSLLFRSKITTNLIDINDFL